MKTNEFKQTLSLLQKQVELMKNMNKDFIGLSIDETLKLEKALFKASQKLEKAQVVLWKNGKV